jgi:hypothetical protein
MSDQLTVGQILTTEEDIHNLVEAAEAVGRMTAVVAHEYHTPWILFTAEDGELYAHTVPDDGPKDRKFTVTAEQLLSDQASDHLRVLWDGIS